jgi:hypothetical protein
MSESLDQSQAPTCVHYELAIYGRRGNTGTRKILLRQGKKLGVSF